MWQTFATIIRPYIFENKQHETLRLNTETYWGILENFFTPGLHCVCMQNLWFQQDGTTSHTARICKDMLQNIFQNDTFLNLDLFLSLQDIWTFLWALLNSSVFPTHPATPENLKTRIWKQPLPLFHRDSYRKQCVTYFLG